jgi:hypothetical protein
LSARAASRTRAKSASDATNARRSARGEGDTARGMTKAHAMRAPVSGGRSPRRLLYLLVVPRKKSAELLKNPRACRVRAEKYSLRLALHFVARGSRRRSIVLYRSST